MCSCHGGIRGRPAGHAQATEPRPGSSGEPRCGLARVPGILELDVDGLETAPDSDADGFAVSWGRYSWHGGLPSLSFHRYLAVDVSADWTETEWYQPEYWQVGLDMVFAESPDLADLDTLNTQDSGIYYERPGPKMDEALREALWEIEQQPTLQVLWASTPLRSTVDLDPSD